MTTVSHFNSVLHKHRQLLEAIWEGTLGTIGEENARAIAELKAHQVVITDDEGNVRLSRSYRELLERSVGRRGNYAASRNIGDDVDRLRAATVDAEAAYVRQDEMAHFDAIREGSDIIWELADTLKTVVTDYERLMQDGLGATGSAEARIRRGEFAISRLRALGEGLVFLVSGPLMGDLAQQSCRDLRREFGRLIGDRLDLAVQRIARTTHEINRMILEDREVLAETRRTRALLRALRQVSHRERVEALVHDLEASVRIGFRSRLLPDVLDPELEDIRDRTARSMKPIERRRPREVITAGSPDETDTPQIRIEMDPDAELAEKFEDELPETGSVSLREWLGIHHVDADEDPDGADFAFEVIMGDVLAEPTLFEVAFVPPLSEGVSSRIHDIRVSRIP